MPQTRFLTLQVSSATATFAMMFSSSIAVVEYYLLHRFPVPYAFLHRSGFFCCDCWPAGFEEADQFVRAGIIYHLHISLLHLDQRDFSRWSRHLQQDLQDGAAQVHGI